MSPTPPTIPQSAIERAARAMYEAGYVPWEGNISWDDLATKIGSEIYQRENPDWHSDLSQVRDYFISLAKIALQSLGDEWRLVPREPTPLMISIGASVLDGNNVFMGGPSQQSRKNIAKVWPAMLEAAHTQPDTVKTGG